MSFAGEKGDSSNEGVSISMPVHAMQSQQRVAGLCPQSGLDQSPEDLRLQADLACVWRAAPSCVGPELYVVCVFKELRHAFTRTACLACVY